MDLFSAIDPHRPYSTLFPYTTLFRSRVRDEIARGRAILPANVNHPETEPMIIGSVSGWFTRSEEHTSELQSHHDLVCRLLLEKKKFSLSAGLPVFSISAIRAATIELR